MPTETQLEQRVAALQSDLNARDQALDDAAIENNERELSRRDWFEETQRLEKENEGLRSEVKRLDLMVAQSDYNYDMDRAQFKRQLAERDALLRRITGSDHQDSLRAIGEAAALSASAEPERSKCGACHGNGFTGQEPVECGTCDGRGYSALIERDKRAEFEQALRSIAGIPGDSINYHATHMSRIARAALERKP
ncbi:hypothetical protein [Pseudomonas sp. KCJK8993]|uniref:hypothetical protein n=1 Tax=Pseudomonas sp. KCJK8993 TaxID=3344565 RepID=UPI0039064BEB